MRLHLLKGLNLSSLFGVFEALQDLAEIVLHDLDPVALVVIGGLVTLDFILRVLDSGLELLLLVVELVFKRQEVLVERDAIAQERFIPTRLVLLVDLLVLEQFDLRLHRGDLLVQVQDDVFMDAFRFAVFVSPRCKLLYLVCCLLQV